ncbi:protein phosphatase 2C domain-containing protein [Nocardiopsis alba]
MTDSRPGSARANEDWVGNTHEVTVVLDGLTAPEGVGGCIHGTPWYVSRLGNHLLEAASVQQTPLRESLRKAISGVSAEHADSCDLSNPGTPSSTVALVRVTSTRVEALVLADSPVVVDLDHGLSVITDQSVETVVHAEREAALAAPTGSQEKADRMAELVRAQRLVRNTPEGYWIAGANPDAADHAIERSWPREEVRRFAAMTDGVSCLVDVYNAMSWSDLLNTAQANITDVISTVRRVEDTDPEGVRWPRYKKSDDATIAYVELD